MSRNLKAEGRVVARLWMMLPDGPLRKKIGRISPAVRVGPDLILAAYEVLKQGSLYPSPEDLDQWRKIFEDAQYDKDVRIVSK